jgi:type II secretory pathway component PulF
MERMMLVEINFVLNLNLIAYLLLGFGIGIAFYYMFYNNNSDSKLDRMKHDLAVKKEWIRLLSEQKATNPTWPAEWHKGA